jgi:ATP-dependent exoDNAse (exonuclease V) alpha subunit
MRNLDVKRGHCNGIRYIIVNIIQRLITAKCLETDEIILIPRIPSHTKNLAFEMKQLQFPVKVAFAMTFNRAQGQSLRKCGILLLTSVWTHGQLYVALSRCSNKRNLKIYANQDKFIHLQLLPGYYTRNVVYSELFNN